MIDFRDGKASDSGVLAELICSSAPILLPYLFGNYANVIEFISQAGRLSDGQYSARRHHVATDDDKPFACITLWDDGLPASFHTLTLSSLHDFLSKEQIFHIVAVNERISEVFQPPMHNQLCIGHVAVDRQYQGQGYGRRLIDYAVSQARTRNKDQIILDVDANNERAITFYLSAGFTLSSTSDFAPTKQSFMRLHYTL